MKRLMIITFILFFLTFTYGQKASIGVSYTTTSDNLSILPDSINISNLVQGGDTTLYLPDTTLVLHYVSVGISDNNMGSKDLVLSSNYITLVTKFDLRGVSLAWWDVSFPS